MKWTTIGMIALVGSNLLVGVLMVYARLRARRLYRELVGLDLAGLVSLLPSELQERKYTDFILRPWIDAGRIGIGLVYHVAREAGVIVHGTPPHVGLEFDARSGALLEIHPDGIALGQR